MRVAAAMCTFIFSSHVDTEPTFYISRIILEVYRTPALHRGQKSNMLTPGDTRGNTLAHTHILMMIEGRGY